MKSALAAAVVGSLTLMSGAAYAEDSDVQSSAASKAAPFAKVSKPCGTEGNLYFCLSLKPDDRGPKLATVYSVNFPSKGTAVVNWNGSVFCDVMSVPDVGPTQYNLRVGETSTFVDLAITQGSQSIVYNAPGALTVGDTAINYVPREVGFAQISRTFLVPAPLSKTFEVKPGKQTYQVLVRADFRKFGNPAFCNINGGTMSIQFFPR
ncbi:hypothetical protein ACFOWB_02460 [Chenggangzhangella methanolivorans]|uniref:hypothetical protein n=1 Tax=Chenggangzhangella methanolivorans TaxID=1437009 RepID=UPI003616F5AC